ncbi:MAG: hypothetical protein ACYDAO_02200 [Thermoplasmataceae archaeon]
MREGNNLNKQAIKYGVSLLFLIVLTSLSQFSGILLFFYIFLSLILLIGIRFLGVLINLSGHLLISKIIKYIISGAAFVFIIDYMILLFLYRLTPAFDPSYSFIPFFLLTLWILWIALGDDNELSIRFPHISEFLKKLSTVFLFFSISAFAYFYSYLSIDLLILFPAFLYLSISAILFSIFPLLISSPRKLKRDIGEYISSSHLKWEFAAFILGFFQGILFIPKPAIQNQIILGILLFLIIVTIFSAIWRTYKSFGENFEGVQINFYERFKRKEAITFDLGIDYMSKAIEDFNATGKKERLILSITSYLTKLGLSESEVEGYLKGIIAYKTRNLNGYSGSNKRSIMRYEIRLRANLVKGMIQSIKRNLGEDNAE